MISAAKGVRSQESGVRRAPARTFEDLIVWQKGRLLDAYMRAIETPGS
jgi:hypothetical protein